MTKIFFKKILYTFLTPKYNFEFHQKYYIINNKLVKKIFNSLWFLPNNHEFSYWKNDAENIGHGYLQFIEMDKMSILLEKSLNKHALKNDKILDICCNVGRLLSSLKSKGYENLYGFDINHIAIQKSSEIFKNLENIKLENCSAEFFLENAENEFYDITYTMGASIELLPPTFDVVKNIYRITKKFFICLINPNGHRYPRFWEYEFKKNGFKILEKINIADKDRTLFILQK